MKKFLFTIITSMLLTSCIIDFPGGVKPSDEPGCYRFDVVERYYYRGDRIEIRKVYRSWSECGLTQSQADQVANKNSTDKFPLRVNNSKVDPFAMDWLCIPYKI